MEEAIIVDIDGTIANCKHRLDLIKKEPKDWDKFHELSVKDTVIEKNMDLIKIINLYSSAKPIFITGRPLKLHHVTKHFIQKNFNECLNNFELFMREYDDKRKTWIVKRELYFRYVFTKYDVKMVFEDDPRCIRMYRDLGLNVIDVNESYE